MDLMWRSSTTSSTRSDRAAGISCQKRRRSSGISGCSSLRASGSFFKSRAPHRVCSNYKLLRFKCKTSTRPQLLTGEINLGGTIRTVGTIVMGVNDLSARSAILGTGRRNVAEQQLLPGPRTTNRRQIRGSSTLATGQHRELVRLN